MKSAMTDYPELLAGYARFRAHDWTAERERWRQLSHGQSPKIMIIACSDSRVDPAQIFDTGPGEVFVVRNVAALVPPFETGGGYHGVSAALEFAVTQLEVEHILVMGHGACGGCKAALSRSFAGTEPGEGGFIKNWIALLAPARDKVAVQDFADDKAAETAMEQEGVKISLTNLRTFPFVVEREQAGKLNLHGGHFAIEHGILNLLDEEQGTFTAAT